MEYQTNVCLLVAGEIEEKKYHCPSLNAILDRDEMMVFSAYWYTEDFGSGRDAMTCALEACFLRGYTARHLHFKCQSETKRWQDCWGIWLIFSDTKCQGYVRRGALCQLGGCRLVEGMTCLLGMVS